MNGSLFVSTVLVSVVFVVAEALLAGVDGALTPGQMRQKYPAYPTFLPFAAHLGMWSDLVLLTPLMAWIVAAFAPQWTFGAMLWAVGGGTSLSLLFHWSYAQSPIPDSLTWKGGVTRAGYVHIAYTALSLAIIGLFFFASRDRTLAVGIAVATALAVHLTVSGRVFLGLVNRLLLRFDWCPDQLGEWPQWAILLAGYALLAAIVAWPIG